MEGLEKFREAFEAYSDNYVIIGGTACDITMTGTTVRPRATHDIDMIVVVEKMTADFAEHFWQFIREGGYRPEKRKQEEGETPKYELYRFVNGKPDYPEMIELLSRHPDHRHYSPSQVDTELRLKATLCSRRGPAGHRGDLYAPWTESGHRGGQSPWRLRCGERHLTPSRLLCGQGTR